MSNPNQARGGNPENPGQFSSDGSRRSEVSIDPNEDNVYTLNVQDGPKRGPEFTDEEIFEDASKRALFGRMGELTGSNFVTTYDRDDNVMFSGDINISRVDMTSPKDTKRFDETGDPEECQEMGPNSRRGYTFFETGEEPVRVDVVNGETYQVVTSNGRVI